MTVEERVLSFVRKHEAEMFALLEKLVLINSGTRNKAGVDRIAALAQKAFQSNRVACRTFSQDRLGDHLIVRSMFEKTFERQILILGHMDTVFPEDSDFNWYEEDQTNCYGPGVIDMKGGLAVGIYAMKALDSIGLLHKIPVTFLLNSDEEIGSPSSRDLIKEEAEKSSCAFVLECGGLQGQVVTGRKGNLSLRVDVFGEAGHAAFAGKDKASAILEMAHKIIGLEGLNAPGEGISANVGRVEGGIGPNTVADRAGARVDFRFARRHQQAYLNERISEIISSRKTPGTRSEFEIVSTRPPMEQSAANRDLFQRVDVAARRLGFEIAEEFRSGVSDANIVAELNIPVVDGMGPWGADDHSSREYMVKSSLVQRSALLACAILECRDAYLKGIASSG